MIRFTRQGGCRVRDALDEAADGMQAEIRRQTAAVERALARAEEALSTANAEHARLTAERNAAGALSAKNQEALFSYEDRLGKVLTEHQTASCQQAAAQAALSQARDTLLHAQALSLPEESAPGYEMMAGGKRAAVKNAEKAIGACEKRFAAAKSRTERLDAALADAKPAMDACRRNLAVLRELCSDISRQIRAIEQYRDAIAPLARALPEEREACVARMYKACKALEEPRAMAKEAAACIEAYTEAMNAIRYHT